MRIVTVLIIFALVPVVLTAEASTTDTGPTAEEAARALRAAEARQEELREAESHLRALASAFPSRVDDVDFVDDDWAISIDGQWFYWARGRLLRAGERSAWEDYSPVRFYNYYPGPARLRQLPPEREAALRGDLSSIDARRPPRNPSFADALYAISSQREAEAQVREIEFLGRSTRIHRIAYDALKRVEERVLNLAEDDVATREFVASLASVHGYNWRTIAGSGSRSYHSYGLAIDLVPRSYGRRPVYWRWASEAGWSEWWRIPIEDRWAPPQEVVDAFEAEGFYWGGKWLFFDNLHFEYRPEVFLF